MRHDELTCFRPSTALSFGVGGVGVGAFSPTPRKLLR
jgi:hypothetical protein